MKTDTGRNALRHHDPPFGEVEDDRCHSRNASEHKPAVKAPRPLINRSHCVRANKPTQISNGINQRDSGRRRRSCLASRSLEASSFPSMCCSGNSSPSQSNSIDLNQYKRNVVGRQAFAPCVYSVEDSLHHFTERKERGFSHEFP